MARLTTSRAAGAVGGEVDRNRRRDAEQPWRRWYSTARWQRLRESIRARDLFTCAMCGRVCAGRGNAVVDHRVPHRGDELMFWDESNLWTLCKPCHDGAKQREERGGRMERSDGWRP